VHTTGIKRDFTAWQSANRCFFRATKWIFIFFGGLQGFKTLLQLDLEPWNWLATYLPNVWTLLWLLYHTY